MRRALQQLVVGLALATVILIESAGLVIADADQFTRWGLAPNHAFGAADFDIIDLHNGNLHFERVLFNGQVDSGFGYQIKMVYNSTVWNWHQTSDRHSENADGGEMRLGMESPVGMGFRLHMGRVYRIHGQDEELWFFEDQSGTPHRLRHQDQDGQSYWWTKDSTFMRARKIKDAGDNLIGWELWKPDGTHYEMRHHVPIGNTFVPGFHGWYTSIIRSPIEPNSNWVEITYDAPNPACISQITDSIGRTTLFTNQADWDGTTVPGGLTRQVSLPAFGGLRAIYVFDYLISDVARPRNGPALEVGTLLLDKITFPGGAYQLGFGYVDPVRQENLGAVAQITLPAGSRISYHWTVPDSGRVYITRPSA